MGLAEAEAGGRQGDQGGLGLLSGEFLGGLYTSLCHPYLWFTAHFRIEFSI